MKIRRVLTTLVAGVLLIGLLGGASGSRIRYQAESGSLTCTSAVNGPVLDIEDAGFCVMVVDVTAITGTTPTTTPRYQGSWDETTFYTIASGAAISAVGVQVQQSAGAWPRHIRVRLSPAGRSRPARQPCATRV